MTSVMNLPGEVEQPDRGGVARGGAGLPEAVEVVIGVDTHEGFHVAAAVNAISAGVIATIVIDADEHGYAELVRFADGLSGLRAWAIEGTMSHGAGLSRHLLGHEELIYELDRPVRAKRWRGEKTDTNDAVRAAREAIARPRLACPKTGGVRAALAAKMIVRRSAVQHATDAERQLRSLIVTAPESLRTRFAGQNLPQIVATAARLRLNAAMQKVITTPATCDPHQVELAFTTATARQLAQRAQTLRAEATAHEKDILRLVRSWRPDLLDQIGIGPIVAASVLCAWSHTGRIHSPAAFGMLAGTAPLLAASGIIQDRHRLNRSGNRQLNRAIHTIALTRQQHDPDTIAYTQRRTSEGKNPREIRRCLKNYIAREIYRLLENPNNHPQPLDQT
jgi:transposase